MKDVTNDSKNDYRTFNIINSTNGYFGNSTIPPDTSICEDCINDIFQSDNIHYLHAFTNCVNCGPRYTISKKTPYDRENTTMDTFKLCPKCDFEYKSINNRRYYAQGISCKFCGPKHILIDRDENIIEKEDDTVLEKTAELISNGFIVAIKSDGGYNLVCDAKNKNTIKNMRKKLNRLNQPFAILCNSIETIKKYAKINKLESNLLLSKEKPIVICNKIKNSELEEILDIISPKLHNIGLLLPYTGTQILLFHYLKKYNIDSIIDTSANIPGNPMIIYNEDAIKNLSCISNYLLLNNRDIYNRNDDSVIRLVNNKPIFLRRSRGFVPLSIEIPFKTDKCIVGMGAEMNNTISLLRKNNIYLSQHIGNTKNVGANKYHQETIIKYSNLLGMIPNIYVSDMHPNFNTTKTSL